MREGGIGEQCGEIGPSLGQNGGKSDLNPEGKEGLNSKLLVPVLVIIVPGNSEI